MYKKEYPFLKEVDSLAAAKCFSKEYLLFFCWIEPETICYVQFFFSPWVLMY